MIFCKECGLRVIVGSGYSGSATEGYTHGNCLWEIVGALREVAVRGNTDLWFPVHSEVLRAHNDNCPPTNGEYCPRCHVRGGR